MILRTVVFSITFLVSTSNSHDIQIVTFSLLSSEELDESRERSFGVLVLEKLSADLRGSDFHGGHEAVEFGEEAVVGEAEVGGSERLEAAGRAM